MDLVKGQNTAINENLAYKLAISAQGWEVDVLLGRGDNFCIYDKESGLSLSTDALFINISDIKPNINKIVVYAKRRPLSSSLIDCNLINSLTGKDVVGCISGVIESTLNAIELIHVYKIKDKWKIKSCYQGYVAGEEGLLSSYGIKNAIKHNLLDQGSDTLSKLEVMLNWNPACSKTFSTSQAYMDNMAPSISTLNLSCLYVLKSGQRGLIHGESDDCNRGSDHGVPFARIINSYDTGKCSLVFNTKYVHKMFKYVVCAEISEGSRCWEDVGASLESISDNTQESLMINSPLHTPIYVYAVLEIIDGILRTKVINQYFTNYQEIASVTGFANA